MRDTGIVRRIDELGRVVIPKEIRKTLRIKEGDPLEIYTEKGELLFKKYSPVSSISAYSQIVADSISEMTDKTCAITDTDTVLYVGGGKFKELIGKNISSDIEKILKERKTVITSAMDGDRIVPIIKGESISNENQVIVSIVANGDCYGSVIVFDTNKNQRISSAEVKLVELGRTFLSKQFEN